METMRALVYDRPSVCSVRDVPMPVCGEDEVGTLSHHHRS